MSFTGFTRHDFASLAVEGLEPRMEAIRTRIQPKFRALSDDLLPQAALLAGQEMFLHIAKHARRTVNPPADTWMAMCHTKRGYKAVPHFQVGLWDDRAFIWLAFIYELPDKKQIANKLLSHSAKIRKSLPKDMMISHDHMKKEAACLSDLSAEEWKRSLERFRDVGKAEWLIGRVISADDPLAASPAFAEAVKETIAALMPIYKLCLDA